MTGDLAELVHDCSHKVNLGSGGFPKEDKIVRKEKVGYWRGLSVEG